jgi:hypothetical protein
MAWSRVRQAVSPADRQTVRPSDRQTLQTSFPATKRLIN